MVYETIDQSLVGPLLADNMSRPHAHVPAGILTRPRACGHSQQIPADTSMLGSSVKGAPQVFKPVARSLPTPVAAAQVVGGCEVCKSGTNPDKLLVCDDCNGEYHIYCLQPKLDAVPDGDWFCPECTCSTLEPAVGHKIQLIETENAPVSDTTSDARAASQKKAKRAPYQTLARQLEQQEIDKERWRDTERQKDAQFLRQRRMAIREERLSQNRPPTTTLSPGDQKAVAPPSATTGPETERVGLLPSSTGGAAVDTRRAECGEVFKYPSCLRRHRASMCVEKDTRSAPMQDLKSATDAQTPTAKPTAEQSAGGTKANIACVRHRPATDVVGATSIEGTCALTAYTATNPGESRAVANAGEGAGISVCAGISVAQVNAQATGVSKVNDAPKISETGAVSSSVKLYKPSTPAVAVAPKPSKSDRIVDTAQGQHRPKRAAKSTSGSNARGATGVSTRCPGGHILRC
jgi:hypothetical protein